MSSFEEYLVYPTTNLDHWDPDCLRHNLLVKKPKSIDKIDYILNNSFTMPDIKSAVLVGRLERQNCRYGQITRWVHMSREQARASISKVGAQVPSDEDLINLNGDTPVPEQMGPGSIDILSVSMEPQEPYDVVAPRDDRMQPTTPGNSIACLEPRTK